MGMSKYCIPGYICSRRRIQRPIEYTMMYTTRKVPTIFCISKSFRKLIRTIFQYGLLCFVWIILLIWLGSEYEQYNVRNTIDTIHLYNQKSDVCAFYYPTKILGPRNSEQQQPNISINNITTTTNNNSITAEQQQAATSSQTNAAGQQQQQQQYGNDESDMFVTALLESSHYNSTTTMIVIDSDFENRTTATNNYHHYPPLVFKTYPSVEEAKKQQQQQLQHYGPINIDNDSNSTAMIINSSNYGLQEDTYMKSTTNTTNNNTNNANDDIVIAHCGECGGCSNPHDINIYDETKSSLFSYTTRCAKLALMGGRKTATTCMMNTVGLTKPCTDCWVENILCDLRKCIFTCMWYGLFVTKVDGTKELNPCTLCDEKRCGPQFIHCAGANRRRCGIISDIERDQQLEVCTKIDDHDKVWWKNIQLQNYYEQTKRANNND